MIYDMQHMISGLKVFGIDISKYAIDNAKEYDEEVSKELARLIIHGTLHLLNYKDNTDDEKFIMTELENKYLKDFDWNKIF